MGDIKVSVGVAVYNTESFLPKCIDSLLAQTLKEIEIILVDDGSTDNSGKICDEYAARDRRIKVFHKENGGLASARQLAIEKASGEYYIPCDSDDWIEANAYEELYNKAKLEDADLVICDYYTNYPNGTQLLITHNIKSFDQNYLLREVLMHRIPGSTWNKLVKTALFSKYKLKWEIGINQGEDVFIFLKLLQYPIKVSYSSKAYYHYRRDLSSNTYTMQPKFTQFKQLEYIHKWKINTLDNNLFAKELFSSSVDVAYFGIRIKDMPKEYYLKFVRDNIRLSHLFKYKFFTLKSLLVIMSKINYNTARFLNDFFYRFVYR